MFVTGCGVAAPKNVASINGIGVTMSDVDTTARDPLYQLVSEGADEAVLPGDAARQALTVAISKAVWIAEARSWGLDLDPHKSDAEAALDEQLAAMPESTDLTDDMRAGFIDLFAAQLALQEHFAQLDPADEADLREVYDRSPMLWDRTCAYILIVPTGAEDKVKDLVDDGVAFEDIADQVEGAQLATSPENGCMSEASVPAQIRDDLKKVAVGSSDLFVIEDTGVAQQYMVHVESRGTVGFTDAHDDLVSIVSALAQSGPQEWVNLKLVEAGVDPRFGSGVTMDGQGQPYVVPPEGPIQRQLDLASGLDLVDG